MDKIKVLIVDDSAIIRQFLSQILSEDPEIEVVGTALDPVFAIEKIMKNRPDVITLDVEMPRMDGLTFLKKIMASDPIPVIMFSSYTRKGCETTIKALEAGAVDFVAKPESGADGLGALAREIVTKVKNAAKANLSGFYRKSFEHQVITTEKTFGVSSKSEKIIIIGASTGGVNAVKQIISEIPLLNTSIIIILHMPVGFTLSFANSLDALTEYKSKEAENEEVLRKNHIYVAPGGKNMILSKRNNELIVQIVTPEQGDFYKPSVNKAFSSAVKVCGTKIVGVLLTGMGDDGAQGLLQMKNAGCSTIAQDKQTSVVFGMPKRAIELGAVEFVEPLGNISDKIVQLAGQ